MFEHLFKNMQLSAIGAKVVDDTKDFTIPVYVPPPPEEGKGYIVSVLYPDEFTPGDSIRIEVRAVNKGGTDNMFIRIKNRDTGSILDELSCPGNSGSPTGVSFCEYPWVSYITLTQTTDFHGRVEVGHIE